MKILVTGSSGVLGINVVEYLRDKNCHDLILFDIVKNELFDQEGMTYIQGDIRNRDLMGEITRGVDIIVHSAATSPSYDRETIFSTIVGGTETLLEAALQNGVKRFVYISSTSVYGVPQSNPVYEDDETVFYDPYNESKIHAEAVCREYRKKGMCIPVLRPRTFIGPGRLGTFSLLFEWAREGKNFPMVGPGKNRYQFLDVKDLSQAVYLAMTAEESDANRTFNIGAGGFTTMKEDYQAVLNEAGHGKRVVSLPAKPVEWMLGLLYLLKLSPLYKRLYKKLTLDYYVSIEKAQKYLGYKPEYTNKMSLVRNYRWYLDNYDRIGSLVGNNNSVQWNHGIFKLVKRFF